MIKELHRPFKVLLTNKGFKKLLKFILKVYNYMYMGKNKGNKKGFKLETLDTLDMCKGYDGTTNFLQYIIKCVNMSDKSILGFVEHFLDFKVSSEITMTEIEKDLGFL